MTGYSVPVHASDLQLAASICQRDRKAIARLIELHADSVHRYVWRRLTPKTDLADDIVQDVFVAAWRGMKTYSGDASLQTWLLSIARHKVEDYYRQTLKAPLESLETDQQPLFTADSVDLDAALDRSRQIGRAAKTLAHLPPGYAAILRWRYWDGQSTRDMATATGRTEKAVERLLARARDCFKTTWMKQEEEST
ncbi:MAG: RNA polymerase sigma factor [Acidobacteriota bacterium]